MKPLIILGAGGHSRVLLDIAALRGYSVLGFSVPHATETEIMGYPVLGTDEDIISRDPSKVLLVNGVGSIASLERRFEVYDRFCKQGFHFATLIHPSAVVAEDAILAEGVQLMAGTVIQPGSSIGENSIVNTKAAIDHDCTIGEHVHICPGVTLSGGVRIGKCSHIGTGAAIIQSLTIGEWSLVGAGSVVLKNVEARQMVVGAPAKVIKNMRDWKRILVSPSASIREVIDVINQEAMQIALVVDETNHLLGSVTDGDIRRALLADRQLGAPIEEVMNKDPVVLMEKANRNTIINVMHKSHVHQIPIVDGQNRVVGLELLQNLLF